MGGRVVPTGPLTLLRSVIAAPTAVVFEEAIMGSETRTEMACSGREVTDKVGEAAGAGEKLVQKSEPTTQGLIDCPPPAPGQELRSLPNLTLPNPRAGSTESAGRFLKFAVYRILLLHLSPLTSPFSVSSSAAWAHSPASIAFRAASELPLQACIRNQNTKHHGGSDKSAPIVLAVLRLVRVT
ncbi:hypothetical protein NPX13_g11277 [Xylaria arbuscula]|uniref:Uncharacterized protein n=1 Tax=Xylaria arbuscula TaxID=114810 RepID=A0A9W8N300_9PEZI|nr:hypothetical protein NPX13_g11277 [Xylaria arbuscula]